MVSPIGGGSFDISALRSQIQAQAQQQFQQQFSNADTDSSGTISFDEFEAAPPPRLQNADVSTEEAFSTLDTDGDGLLTQEEVGAKIKEGLSQVRSQFSSGNFLQLLEAQEGQGLQNFNVSNDFQNNIIDAFFGDDENAA